MFNRFVLTLCCTLLCGPAFNTFAAGPPPLNDTRDTYVAGRVAIQFAADVPLRRATLNLLANRLAVTGLQPLVHYENAALAREVGLDRFYTATVNDTETPQAAAQRLLQSESVAYAQPVHRYQYFDTTPNDPYYTTSGSWGQDYDDQWGLYSTGLTPLGTESGWDIERDETGDMVIAVIDSGIALTHPDLAGNLWTNPGETPGDGIDNDGNGYIDDVYGYDFANDDADPTDDVGHGTHCAGTIAALTNNGTGVAGVSWGSRIMAVKGLGTGGGSSVKLANAIAYAADNGAKILSNSWGSVSRDETILAAMDYAIGQGCLVLAAAGNDSLDIDALFVTPSSYQPVVSVAAIDHEHHVASFSNYGASIDFAAPGVGILSLRAAGTDMYEDGEHIVADNYYYANGTSMACPHGAGVAALLWAHNPTWTAEQVNDRLNHTAVYLDALNPDYRGLLGGGCVNARRALTMEPQPMVVLSQVTLAGAESLLDNDHADPGETVELEIKLTNRWETVDNITGQLVSDDPCVTVNQGTLTFGTIDEGEIVTAGQLAEVSVSADAPYDEWLSLVLEVAGDGYSTTVAVPLQVSVPRVRTRAMFVDDSSGNNNGYAEAGENVELLLFVENAAGAAEAGNLTATLVTNDEHLTITQPVSSYGDLLPQATAANYASRFAVQLDADFPAAATTTLQLRLTADHAYAVTHTVALGTPDVLNHLWALHFPVDATAPPPLPSSFAMAAETSGDGRVYMLQREIFEIPAKLQFGEYQCGMWRNGRTNLMEPGHYWGAGPVLVPDDNGDLHAAFHMDSLQRNASNDLIIVREVYYTCYQNGAWSDPVALSGLEGMNGVRALDLTLDSQGRIHVAWLHFNMLAGSTVKLYHCVCTNGVWSEKQLLHEEAGSMVSHDMLHLDKDSHGSVLLSYSVYGNLQGAYFNGTSWSSVGSWLSPGNIYEYRQAVDNNNRIHLVWAAGASQYYTVADLGGSFSTPVAIGSADSEDSANALWHDQATGLLYLTCHFQDKLYGRVLADGTWNDWEVLWQLPADQTHIHTLNLVADRRGHRHLMWYVETDAQYRRMYHVPLEARQLRELPTESEDPQPPTENAALLSMW